MQLQVGVGHIGLDADRGLGDPECLSFQVRDLILLEQSVIIVDPDQVPLDLQENPLPDSHRRHVVPVAAIGKKAILVHLAEELQRGVVVGWR